MKVSDLKEVLSCDPKYITIQNKIITFSSRMPSAMKESTEKKRIVVYLIFALIRSVLLALTFLNDTENFVIPNNGDSLCRKQ